MWLHHSYSYQIIMRDMPFNIFFWLQSYSVPPRNDLIDIDEGVGIVCEIVEEVVEKASKIIYERYLDGELFSYAVQRAKESILKIIGVS